MFHKLAILLHGAYYNPSESMYNLLVYLKSFQIDTEWNFGSFGPIKYGIKCNRRGSLLSLKISNTIITFENNPDLFFPFWNFSERIFTTKNIKFAIQNSSTSSKCPARVAKWDWSVCPSSLKIFENTNKINESMVYTHPKRYNIFPL